MKKVSLLLITMLLFGIYSCNNEEWQFDDFDYTTTYFPYQFPVRTLVLGDYYFNNENDNNLKFLISARMGGVYENKANIKVEYQLDPTLVTKLIAAANLFDGKSTSSVDTLKVLPSQYYTFNPASEFTIPKGKFTGGVEVQLTDAFLNDTMSARTKYVIPLRIVSSTTDSVLRGKTTLANADPRVAGQWVTAPKDFTIFGIKYVNKYHGKYLHRGISVITDTVASTPLDTIAYRQKYVEKDELWSLQTINRYAVTLSGILRKVPTSPGSFKMNLTFDSNDNCVVTTARGSAFRVSGTGKFVSKGDMWGNTPRDVIYLNYIVREGRNQHAIKDTIVFRDKAVTFLEYSPTVLP